MAISVVIPYWDAATTLPYQLDALARQKWPERGEVIIANNEPRADLSEIVDAFAGRLPGLRVVEAHGQKGPGYARNVGVSCARGEKVLFCDADDEVGGDWLPAMAQALGRHGFVACRREVDVLNEPWLVEARPEAREIQSTGLVTTHDYLPWACGATLGVRREVHRSVGGFDTGFVAFEDLDYCWRIQQSGTPLVFVPEALLHYRLRRERAAILRQSRIYAENYVLLYKRYARHGLQRPRFSWTSFLRGRGWLGLARRLPGHWGDEQGMAEWIWYFGWRLGCLTGSIKHRYLML